MRSQSQIQTQPYIRVLQPSASTARRQQAETEDDTQEYQRHASRNAIRGWNGLHQHDLYHFYLSLF